MTELKNLRTLKNYSKLIDRTPQRVYQMEEEGLLDYVWIDGARFIDVSKAPKTIKAPKVKS
jgi:hypothetical protein